MAFKGDANLRGVKKLSNFLADARAEVRDVVNDRELAELMLERIKRRFDTKYGPDGKRWKPLSQNSRFKRNNPDRSDILVDSGRLRDAVRIVGARAKTGIRANVANVVRIGVTGGKQGAKAAVHQFGGYSGLAKAPIPARPFLGFGVTDVKILQQKIRERFKKVESRRGRNPVRIKDK